MKILLIFPPLYDVSKYGKITVLPESPHPGLCSLAAYLQANGYQDVVIRDMFDLDQAEVQRIIQSEHPDIVGISCMTEQRQSVFLITRLAKALNPKIKVVLGGHHATYMHRQILENFAVDAVVLGEGEITFLELVRAYEQQKDLKEVKGIAYKHDAEVFINPAREFIHDLDILPMPAYHLVEFDHYYPYLCLRGKFKGQDVTKMKMVRVVFSRGCIYNCIFCSNVPFWGHRHRKRSVEKVIEELVLLKDKYGREYFNFADDIFTMDRQWVISICKEIIDRKLNIVWDCDSRVDYVDEELLQIMHEAGCYAVVFGTETGSAKIIKTLNKKFKVEDIIRAFTLTRKAKIKSVFLCMVGNPGETEDTVKDSKDLIKKLKPDGLGVFITMVFPGTPLYQLCKEKGFIEDGYWLTDKPAPLYGVISGEYQLETLRRWIDDVVLAGTKWRLRVIKFLRNFIDYRFGIRFTKEHIEFWKDGRLQRRTKSGVTRVVGKIVNKLTG